MFTPNPIENPYAAVREEEFSVDIDDVHIVRTKGYDAKGRIVSVSNSRYRDGRLLGVFSEAVEADGYWHGGVCDHETGGGCQTLHPSIEGEVQ